MAQASPPDLTSDVALSIIAELAEPRSAANFFYCPASAASEPARTGGRVVSTHTAYCTELMFVRRGSMAVATPAQLFHLVPGHLLTVDTGVEHGEIHEDESEEVYVGLSHTSAQLDWDRRGSTLHLIGGTDLTYLIGAIRRELSSREWGFERAVHGILEHLACILSRRFLRKSYLRVPWSERANSVGWQAIRAALGHLATHFREELDLQAVARSTGYSYSHLNRFFLRHLGKTMSKYLRDLRIAHGRDLLQFTTLPLSEIAQMSGYGSAASFRRAFAFATGTKLSRYRRGQTERDMGGDTVLPPHLSPPHL